MRVELYRLSMHCVQTSKSLFLVVGKLSLTLLGRFYLQPIVGRPKNLSGGPGVPLTTNTATGTKLRVAIYTFLSILNRRSIIRRCPLTRGAQFKKRETDAKF